MIVQSPGYFDAIRLPLLLGRDFNNVDGSAGHKSAILTRECAEHFWPGQSAVGKRFRLYDDNKPGDWITVVGVSSNLIQDLNESDPKPLLFVPFRQEGWNGMALLVQSNLAHSAVETTTGVRSAVQSLDPDLPLRDVSTLTRAVDRREWFLHLFTKLFLGFALIALLMASVGLYAVIAHATGSRTQEIGVRMALGATRRQISMLFLRRTLTAALLGLACGGVATLTMTRLLRSQLYGVEPNNPMTFLIAILLLLTPVLVASLRPALQAASVDPVEALRTE